jgi:uncharacterized repeat protein (TIGR03809 family)
MTDRTDVARGRDIVARLYGLAEQRLDYLTELYESGRWRRFHGEREFLDNVRDAKAAVEIWRGMLDRDAKPNNLPVDLSWIGKRSGLPLAKRAVPGEPILSIAPQLPEFPEPPAVAVVPEAMEPEPEPVLALDPVTTTEDAALEKTLALTLDIVAMQERYPLLRNTL